MPDAHTRKPKRCAIVTHHHPERIGLRKKRAQQFVGQRMTGTAPVIAPEDRCTGKREIAKSIQHLVAHRFVVVAQTAR